MRVRAREWVRVRAREWARVSVRRGFGLGSGAGLRLYTVMVELRVSGVGIVLYPNTAVTDTSITQLGTPTHGGSNVFTHNLTRNTKKA